jgi:hypothetical protein
MNAVTTIPERRPSLQAGGSIVSIVPQNLDEAFRLSTAIHQAGMAPYGIDTPQKIMIAMLAGLELGMPPMQGVQSIAVINNRPCMWGDALIGVVKNSGVCLYVKEWMEGDGDSRIAFCETKRKGEDEPVKRSFSADDAKRAGLWQTEARVTKQGKNGPYTKDNDSPWFKYPQRMLQMRARAWCLRDVYPDVLKGMQSREEVEDYQHAQAEPVEPQQSLPPLEERLRIARQENAEEAPQQREGFDAAHVARETAALTGEADSGEDNTQSPECSSSDEGSGEASPSPSPAADLSLGDEPGMEAGDIGAADGQSASPASETDMVNSAKPMNTDFLKATMVKKLLQVVGDGRLSEQERLEILDDCRPDWTDKLQGFPFIINQAFGTAAKIIKGEINPDAGRRFMEGL